MGKWTTAIFVLGCLMAAWAYVWPFYGPQLRYIWGDCDAIADGLANDVVWGFRGIHKGIECGDRCLQPMWEKSDHLKRMHERNAPWIAEVLSSNQTPLSVQIASELSQDDLPMRKLVGQVALAKFGMLKDISTLRNTCIDPGEDCNGTMFELAAAGIGYTKDKSVLPALHSALAKSKGDSFWRAYVVCRSLANLHDSSSIPVLEAYLLRPHSDAPGESLKALKAFGEENAIPMAIERLATNQRTGEPDWISQNLTSALEEVTGQRLGANAEDWKNWLSEKK